MYNIIILASFKQKNLRMEPDYEYNEYDPSKVIIAANSENGIIY